MSNRREFFKAGAAVAAGGILTAGLSAPAEAKSFGTYSRWKRSHGGPPDSPEYLGKLVSGFRKPSLPPVPVQTPDTKKLPWTMEDGRKTFRLSCEVVKQEFLPGAWMNVWGFNGSMPGPVIEANQGDRVRIIVTNNLPEPTSMHWHGLEIVVDMDGVPGMTQDLIPPGGQYVYEFDLHQAGSFFYHSHLAMQEAMGMVGWLIIHPATAYTPTVDRDFALIFQNFFNCRMFYIFDIVNTLNLRIHDSVFMIKKGRERPHTDITIFIKCSCKHFTTILFKPRRVISATSKEGYSIWSFSNNQKSSSNSFLLNRIFDISSTFFLC